MTTIGRRMVAKKNPGRRGPPTKYPWDRWFARRRLFRLVKGRDFDCQLHSMMIMIRTKARVLGKRVSISMDFDDESLTVQVRDAAET